MDSIAASLLAAHAAKNLSLTATLLTQAKLRLAQESLLLPTNLDNLPNLVAARGILEIGAFHSIQKEDLLAFERYLNLLSPYYNDITQLLPTSTNEATLQSLSLLRLLSQNRIASFHTLLQLLPESVLDSPPAKWVISLERSLMEGAYSKVWAACSSSTSLPAPEFAFFTKKLTSTVREEIASCHERAYSTLNVEQARVLLFFERKEEIIKFSKEHNWPIESSTSLIHFPTSPLYTSLHASLPPSTTTTTSTTRKLNIGAAAGLSGAELDKEKVVRATMDYARELESIV